PQGGGVTEPLLRVRDLKTYFVTEQGSGTARAVDGVSFEVQPGETLGIVGESGCGKTVTSLSILRLIPEPPGHIRPGSFIEFEGRNLLTLEPRDLRAIRGNQIAMIFQEPMTSLNPVFKVGDQSAEAAIVQERLSHRAARTRAIEMLRLVGIPDPEERVDHYPHQMSGGIRQRVMIAMALVCHPKLLIADEPTTALDVTIQAQILELLDRLQAELGMAVMLITHDLGVVAGSADRVVVMYAGQVVEQAPTRQLFARPLHPYTEGLLASVPRLDTRVSQVRGRLHSIPGQVPAATAWPAGCRFHPRCPYAWDRCAAEEPPLLDSAGGEAGTHTVRCWLLTEPQRRERHAWRGGRRGPRWTRAASPAASHADRVPGSVRFPQSADDRAADARRAPRHPPARDRTRSQAAGRWAARGGRAGSRVRGGLPPRAVRGATPARRDRPGALGRAARSE